MHIVIPLRILVVVVLPLTTMCKCQRRNVCLGAYTKDLAINKTAEASSVFSLSTLPHNRTFRAGTCFHSQEEMAPWWQVDLEANYLIKSVFIKNSHSHPERLEDVRIDVRLNRKHNESQPNSTLCTHVPKNVTKPAETQQFNCTDTILGRYVRLTAESFHPNQTTSLVMCMVQVEGCRPSCCSCCSHHTHANNTPVSDEYFNRIKQEITVNRKQMSQYKRKFISIHDNRVSARAIGYVGIFLLVAFGCIIVLFDVTRFIIFIGLCTDTTSHQPVKRKKKGSSKNKRYKHCSIDEDM